MVHFSYKGGCDIHEHMHIKAFKRTAGLGYRKWLQVISNAMLVIPLRISKDHGRFKFKTILYALLCDP